MEPFESTAARPWARDGGGAAAGPPWEVVAHPRSGQRCLESRRAFSAGDTVATFGAAAVAEQPSRMTIQVSERAHILLAPPALSFMNHDCAPNVHFDVERRIVLALRPIAAGDELSFFYPSTEWVMASPFDCHCGSARCLGRVAGASQVADGALRGRPLAPHVVRLLAESGRIVAP